MKKSPIDFTKKLCIITGASSGIGAEFARNLHRRGANLLLVARRYNLLSNIKEELETTRPASVEILVADLSKSSGPESSAALVAELTNREPFLLINNAGFGSFGLFEELDLGRELAMVRLNVEAHLILTNAVLPKLKAQNQGGIINISSIAGFQPLPTMATYAATKAFELSFSLALYEEYRGTGVRVLAVCPGPVDTEFSGVARVPGTVTGAKRDSADQVVEQSIAAFINNKPFVIPGGRARWLGFLVGALPLVLRTRIVGKQLKKVLDATG